MFDQLPTPSVLVDSRRLHRNIDKAQLRAKTAGVNLRPHIKTHRSLEIARRQLAAGAVGLTCAKPSEAEVFVDGGFGDVRIAYPMVGQQRLERLAALSQRATVSFCVDSFAAALQVSEVFGKAGAVARVLLKIDCGYGRAGWRWNDEALGRRAAQIAALPHLGILGVLTHAGQAYAGPEECEDRAKAQEILASHARDERDRTQQAAVLVGEALGSAAGELEVSIGSTPTFWHFEPSSRARFPVTEVRPGNYVFHDLTQVDLGAATIDQNALSVLATVVSVRERDGHLHALIDGGKKTLTSDRRMNQETYGAVLAESCEQLVVQDGYRLHTLSEEHGWLSAPLDSGLVVGQRLRLLVNHSCVVVSTQRQLYAVEGDRVVGAIEVSAGGCST